MPKIICLLNNKLLSCTYSKERIVKCYENYIKKLKDGLEQEIRTKNLLIARHNSAKIDKELKQALMGIGDSPFGNLVDLENKVDQAEAEAYGDLTGSISLKDQIDELSNDDLEAELEELKKSKEQ